MHISLDETGSDPSKSTPGSEKPSTEPLKPPAPNQNQLSSKTEPEEENLRRPLGDLGSLKEGTQILGVFVPGQPGYEELRQALGMKPLGWKPTRYRKVISVEEYLDSLSPEELAKEDLEQLERDAYKEQERNEWDRLREEEQKRWEEERLQEQLKERDDRRIERRKDRCKRPRNHKATTTKNILKKLGSKLNLPQLRSSYRTRLRK